MTAGPLVVRTRLFLEEHGQRFGRLAVIAAVLLASASLAPLAAGGPWLLTILLSLAGGLVGGLVLLKRPDLGFPAIIVSSLLVRFSIGTGTQTSINSTLLLVAGLTGLWLLDMLVRRQTSLPASPTVPPIIAFVVVALLSLAFGQFYWVPTPGASLGAQLGGLSIFLLSAAAFLLAASRIHDTRTLQWMTWALILLGGIYAVGWLVPDLRRPLNRTFQRAVQDSMFWTWLVALAFSQAWLNRRLPTVARAALALLVLCTLYVTIVIKGGWTSGWLPGVVAVYVVILVRKPRLGLLLGLVGGLGLLVSNLLLAGDNAYSLTTRLEAWRILFELIKLSPILGLGPANYYWYTPLYSILGYHVSFNSHNNYVDIVAQMGLAGLLCFGWFAWTVARETWQLRNRVPDAGFAQAYVYGALGGLAGTLVAGLLGDWVLPFVYNVGMAGFRASVLPWLFLGGLVALSSQLTSGPKPSSSAPAVSIQ